jgi:hypothetical protein
MLTIKNKHYTDLYNKVMNCRDFNQVQEADVDDCILTVHVEKQIYPGETTGGSDDYGNRERIALTTCRVTVINFWVSDVNNAIIPSDLNPSDFDPEIFESMFD